MKTQYTIMKHQQSIMKKYNERATQFI